MYHSKNPRPCAFGNYTPLPKTNMDIQHVGLEKVTPLKKWQFRVSMLDFCGVSWFIFTTKPFHQSIHSFRSAPMVAGGHCKSQRDQWRNCGQELVQALGVQGISAYWKVSRLGV